jgi:hypothetical protein
MSRVWLTYWRVVFSFSAILETDRPVLISDQMIFWLWLSGEETEQFGIIISKYLYVYKYLTFCISSQKPANFNTPKTHNGKSKMNQLPFKL